MKYEECIECASKLIVTTSGEIFNIINRKCKACGFVWEEETIYHPGKSTEELERLNWVRSTCRTIEVKHE